MKRKLRSGILVFSPLMMIITLRWAETTKRRPEVKIETRMTVIIMMKMNARKEKGAGVGRREAKAPMRLKVEQIENKVQYCGRGVRAGRREARGPRRKKEGQKDGREAWKIPSDWPIPTKGRSRRCGTIPWRKPLLFRPDQSGYGGDRGPFLGASIARRALARYRNSSPPSVGKKC